MVSLCVWVDRFFCCGDVFTSRFFLVGNVKYCTGGLCVCVYLCICRVVCGWGTCVVGS